MMPVLETPQKDCIWTESFTWIRRKSCDLGRLNRTFPAITSSPFLAQATQISSSQSATAVGGWRDQGTSDTTSLSMHEITWNSAWQPGVTQIFNKTMNYLKSNGICWIQYINWMSKTNKLGPDRNTRHKCLPASAHCSKPAVGIGQRPFHSQT